MAEKGQSAISTEPVRVNIGSVESTLTGMWSMVVEGQVPGVSAPLTRTIIANVLVYAASDDEAAEAMSIISELSADHPIRAIVADAAPGEPQHELDADVSMLCRITDRGRQLCGEEVRLHAHGLSEAALGSILPVLLPDLPVYFWTPGDIMPDRDIYKQFVGISDHWIIDSRRFQKKLDGLRFATSSGFEHDPHVMLHDLAWISLSHWMDAIASHFDPIPAREYLDGLKNIIITYKSHSKNEPNIESVMLAAWLIDRLDLEYQEISICDDGGWEIHLQFEGKDVSIFLRPDQHAKQSICETIIESSHNDGRKGVFISKWLDTNEILIESDVSDITHIRKLIQPESISYISEVHSGLDAAGKDMLYEHALPIIVNLLAGVESAD